MNELNEERKQNRKLNLQIYLGLFILIAMLGGFTYAFFNYTRTGESNTLKLGNITFETTQNGNINLTNAFPISITKDNNGLITNVDDDNIDTVEILINGHTTYSDGVEYLVSSANTTASITSGNTTKIVPISLDVQVGTNGSGTNNTLGTSDNDYFANRDTYTTSHYKKIIGNTITGDEYILVGFIAPDATNTDNSINGKITIKAYFDNSLVAITDTSDENEGWIQGRTVLTTSEWNSLRTNGVSFQVKVEAQEGIWVDEPPMSLGDKVISRLGNDGVVAINTSGALASGSDTIREYRYSGGGRYCSYENGGTTYNLQIEGNECPETVVFGGGPPGLYTPTADIAAYQGGNAPTGTTYTLVSGTGVQDGTVKNYISFNNELWRIIGVFGDKVKIMKDVPIKTSDSFMTDSGTGVQYTALNNTTYMIKQNFGSSPMANAKYAPITWNSDSSNTKNNWAKAGLQYWLNENNTGSYYNTINSTYKNLIVDDTYYLRNVNISSYGTASQTYDLERAIVQECAASITSNSQNNSCNVWNGNSSEWEGKIALPYPSDFGYAASSSYWISTLNNYWNASNPAIQGDNWFLNNDAYYNWFLSPSSNFPQIVAYWNGAGYVGYFSHGDYGDAVRPVLNLESTILLNGGDGSYTSPYILKVS